MPRFLLLITLFLMLVISGTVVHNKFNSTTITQGDIAGAAQYAFADYWPQPIGAYWRMKQMAGFERCSSSARTTWFVTPPDLLFRGASSRNLENFKTDKCMWNWTNSATSASWVVAYPNYIKTALGQDTHMMRQIGIRRAKLSESANDKIGSRTTYKLPFTNSNNYLKPIEFIGSTVRAPQAMFSQNEDSLQSKGQIPYNIFPYASSVFGQTVDTGLFYACSQNNSRSALNYDYDNCVSPSNWVDMAWDVKTAKVPSSSFKEGITQLANYDGIGLKVTFLEIGGLRYNNQSIGRYKVLADNISINDPNLSVGWIACEHWYFVPGLGISKIDAVGVANTTQTPYAMNLLKGLPNLAPYKNKHPLSKESISKFCADLDFSNKGLGLEIGGDVSRLVLEQSNVGSIRTKLPNNKDRSGKSLLDSPDAVSTFYTNFLMYIDKGRWYTFDFSKGIWASMGDLSSVWGDVYPVVINNVETKPWTYNPYTNTTALVWAPEFLTTYLSSTFPEYASGTMSTHKPKQIVFSNGAYWIWGDGSNKWGCVKNAAGVCTSSFTGSSGKAEEDFQKRMQAKALSGVTPFTNKGPDAVDVTSDGQSLVFVNDGVSWTLKSDGTWSNPILISSVAHFAAAPDIGGIKPFFPESIVQFRTGEYLTGVSTSQATTQQVLFEKGAVFVNYNGKSWEQNKLKVQLGLP